MDESIPPGLPVDNVETQLHPLVDEIAQEMIIIEAMSDLSLAVPSAPTASWALFS